jgi:hypothetical protein
MALLGFFFFKVVKVWGYKCVVLHEVGTIKIRGLERGISKKGCKG